MKPVTIDQSHAVMAALATNVDWSVLDSDSLQGNVVTNAVEAGKQFTAFLLNGARMVISMVFKIVTAIDRDMTGWELLEPAAAEGEFEPWLQELLQESDGGCCGGEEMIKRAKEKGVSSGLRHLEAMLREQEKISVEWRKYLLVSTEVWRTLDDSRYVWYLYWLGGRWDLGGRWLENGFGSHFRLVASRKYQRPLDT